MNGYKALRSWTKKTQKIILVIAGVAAVIGPVILIIGGLISAVGSIIGVFAAASTAIATAGGVIAFLTGPIGIAIVVIGALVAAGVVLYKNWDTVKAFGLNAWGQLKIGVLKAIGAISQAYATLFGWVPKLGSILTGVNAKIQNSIKAEAAIIDTRKLESSIKSAEDVSRSAGRKLGESMKAGVAEEIPSVASLLAGTGGGGLGGGGGGGSAKVKVEEEMKDLGLWASKGLALGLGAGSGQVVSQAQILADATKEIKDKIIDLNKQYEVSYYATGANSDATKSLREQIAQLAQQYDNLTKSIGATVAAQDSMPKLSQGASVKQYKRLGHARCGKAKDRQMDE